MSDVYKPSINDVISWKKLSINEKNASLQLMKGVFRRVVDKADPASITTERLIKDAYNHNDMTDDGRLFVRMNHARIYNLLSEKVDACRTLSSKDAQKDYSKHMTDICQNAKNAREAITDKFNKGVIGKEVRDAFMKNADKMQEFIDTRPKNSWVDKTFDFFQDIKFAMEMDQLTFIENTINNMGDASEIGSFFKALSNFWSRLKKPKQAHKGTLLEEDAYDSEPMKRLSEIMSKEPKAMPANLLQFQSVNAANSIMDKPEMPAFSLSIAKKPARQLKFTDENNPSVDNEAEPESRPRLRMR